MTGRGTSGGRRDFLAIGGLVGGGLLVSIVLPGCAPKPAADASRPRGTFAPNAWLRITPDDRVVFVFDRTEMGQGAMTGHAQLVAEELGVSPQRLIIETARADRAYDNPAYKLQVTGGSSSTREAYLPLRTAAATARSMLVSAAAARWGVAVASCTVEDGVVSSVEAGKSARFGELAEAASREPVPRVILKPRSAFTVIGKSVPRLDQDAKVKGTAVFGIDVAHKGLLSAYVLRAPVLGATLRGFDADVAKKHTGVVDVIAIPTGVAVVAEKYWQALRAAKDVTVRWSEGHTSLDDEALRAAFRQRLGSAGKAYRNDGDFAAAYENAPRKLEAIYELPFLAHATLEPQNATAIVKDGRCEVWAPTQAVGLAAAVVRQITGFSDDAITIHQTMIGGGFGRRAAQDYVAEVVHLAVRLRRPVKIVWSREDDTRNDVYRPMATTLMRAALDPGKGAILGYFQRIATQSILAQSGPDWIRGVLPSRLPVTLASVASRAGGALFAGSALSDDTTTEGAADIAYGIPNIRVEHASVQIDVPVGFWRSVGYSHNTFVAECFFDEMAHALGRDPYELRRALLANAPKLRRVLELAADKAGWKTPAPPGVFRGIAQAKSFGTAVAHVAEVRMENGFPRVQRLVVAVDCGTVINPDIVRAQIEGSVAFALGPVLKQAITLRRGRIEQGNFDDFELVRMNEMPQVEVHLVPSDDPPQGIGEPGVPSVAPAVANAVFAATGQRVRRLPMRLSLEGIQEIPR